MTQMYGKWLFIGLLIALLGSIVVAQENVAVPILLETENAAQREAWQADLTAVFAEQPLMWVDDSQEADLSIVPQPDDSLLLTVRQNTLLRLSPILEPAPPVLIPNDDNVAAITALLWQLTQGECASAQEDTILEAFDAAAWAVYAGNCALIAAHSENMLDEVRLREAAHLFERAFSVQAARVNHIWLEHRAGEKFFTRECISLQILKPSANDDEKAFWYGKRAQFYALDFDFQAALRDLEDAIALDPTNPLYLTRQGEVYLLLYEWNNARAAFDAALALDPTYAPAYFQRGVLLSTMGETNAANEDFRQYLALEPRGVWADLARQYGE